MKLRAPLLVLLLLVLAGCGFHLRGATPLPEVMARTYLSVAETSPLRYELESLLLAAGGEVVTELGQASAKLLVHSVQVHQRLLSVDTQGRAREYALTLVVSYSLQSQGGGAATEQLSSRVERDFRFDPENVLAQSGEREMILQEMYRSAAQQMVRRLSALSLTAPPATEPEMAQ